MGGRGGSGGGKGGGSLERRIRTAYNSVATRPGQFVSINEIRNQIGDVGRATLDQALIGLAKRQDGTVRLIPIADAKNISHEDRAGAVVLPASGTALHGIAFYPRGRAR